MKNKIFALCAAVLFMFTLTPLHAQEDGEVGLIFENDSNEFIMIDQGDKAGAFDDMLPGEERIQKVTLKNDNYQNMKFFVRTEASKSLGEGEVNGEIVYDVRFTSDGEAFYSGKVGGPNKKGIVDLDSNYLLKSLKKGESTEVVISVKVDGTSMDNNYQGTKGNLGFIFSVEHDEGLPDKIITIIKDIPIINQLPGVNTGDTTMVGVLLGVIGVSAVVIVVLIVKKRKGKDEEHDEAKEDI